MFPLKNLARKGLIQEYPNSSHHTEQMSVSSIYFKKSLVKMLIMLQHAEKK